MPPGTHGANGVPAAAAGPERKRVKVYELKNNDWFDRGTGFCNGQTFSPPSASADGLDARVIVVSEEDPSRHLLETRIGKDDGYQKQQETLIVWTENNVTDMALSFQEAEACAGIWEFVSKVQGRLAAAAADDGLSDDLLEPMHAINLPEPQLGTLEAVEAAIRTAASSPTTRDPLARYVMANEKAYFRKLGPLVAKAEELESTPDLHRLCTIMKHLILLNDSSIIEFIVTDDIVMGVVGALEYDPDFPSHRANHRQWLSDTSKFKEVVPIHDAGVREKIHWTYRLLYLKDVVLARILDDPTFSVLNGLIFFHQVDIVNHLQSNEQFLKDLFDIFWASDAEKAEKKKEAVLFIQNCCAVSKGIQAQSRAQLYQNFIQHGLFNVITFSLRHHDAAVRVAGTDILVALIDHDPHMVRVHIFNALHENATPLTDTLIELLLVEMDLGVKSQMADAIKILLDPTTNQISLDMMNRAAGANAELMTKHSPGGAVAQVPQQNNSSSPQTSSFIDAFYEAAARRLFAPLKALEQRKTMSDFTISETSLHTHLVDILCFFVRQHSFKSKLFILSEGLHSRVAQLLSCPQKYMKLTALKWFRTCIGLQDEFHNRQLISNQLFDPILLIVEETMPRDNLLNSTCLELFEYIKREGVKQLIMHLVESYRERLMRISYVNTFQALVLKYEQFTSGYPMVNGTDGSFTTQEGTPQRAVNGRQSFAGLKEMDGDEEAYFNADDDVEDDEGLPTTVKHVMVNGASPVRPLVNYPDEDEEDGMDILASSPDPPPRDKQSSSASTSDDQRTLTDPSDGISGDSMEEDFTSPTEVPEEDAKRGRNRTPVAIEGSPGNHTQSPPEPVLVKRRREEDDEDELGKMMGEPKRRSSKASLRSGTNHHIQTLDFDRGDLDENGAIDKAHIRQQPLGHGHGNAHVLRRKGSLRTKHETPVGQHKLAIKPISLAMVKSQDQDPDPVDEAVSTEVKPAEAVQSGDGDGG